MTDRELLELAAKAAGIRLHVWGTKGAENFADLDAPGERWNPLTDDGAALRLAVKLNMDVRIGAQSNAVSVGWGLGIRCVQEIVITDPYAATRRAIVRAAAAIGATP